MKESKVSSSLTIDGPRGPALIPKKGIFKIAYETKSPILPSLSISSRCKIFSKSWDQFSFPLPFGKMYCFYGEPIIVERLDPDYIETLSLELIQSQEKLRKEANQKISK